MMLAGRNEVGGDAQIGGACSGDHVIVRHLT